MISLDVKRRFNEFYIKFSNNEASIHDISKLITVVRENIYLLSDSQIKDILEIPQSVLTEDVVLKKYNSAESSYFANNKFNQNQIKEIADIGQHFLSGNYDENIFVEIIEFCRNNISDARYGMDFYLRNPEAALRDDVIELKYQTRFEQDQNLFATILKKSLDL